jgi:hypothetical protein
MGQRNPKHQLMDGQNPISILRFQPSVWWCRISLAHPQYEDLLLLFFLAGFDKTWWLRAVCVGRRILRRTAGFFLQVFKILVPLHVGDIEDGFCTCLGG